MLKSSATFKNAYFDPIRKLSGASGKLLAGYVVYSGDNVDLSNNYHALRFDQVHSACEHP